MLESDPNPTLVEVDFTLTQEEVDAFEPYRAQAFKDAHTPERARTSLLWPDQGIAPGTVGVQLACDIYTAALATRKDAGWMFGLSMYLDVPEFKYSHYVGPRAAMRVMHLWRGTADSTTVLMRHRRVADICTTFLHWVVSPEDIEKYKLNGS